MAVFTGSPNSPQGQAWQKLDEKTRNERMAAGMKAWHQWAADHASATTDEGGPLGKTKRTDKNGVSDTRNDLGAWTIVKAETQEDAAKMFLNHPHFMIFLGDRIEVMECLPIPKM